MKYLGLLLLTALLVPSLTFAHPGGTDSLGGHTCWTNCEQYGLQTGEYHFHDENDAAVGTYDNNDSIYDETLAERLHGRILLQVEEHGEAWYIKTNDSKRYYMKDGATAYSMMRYFSLGITDADLALIPSVADTTAMNSSTSVCSTNALANRLKGEILLQVQQHGEAWYVDPVKCRSIYMKDGATAYEIMRFLGLGITNSDLSKIVIGTADFPSSTPVPTPTESVEVEIPSEPVVEDTGADAIDSLTLSGDGSGITELFELKAGLVMFNSTHSGDENFITHLLDSDGETVEYVTNEIGDYSGTSVGSIPEDGMYLLNVDADGDWTIEVSQPRPADGDDLPFTATGTVDDVVGPIYVTSGLHTFDMSHEGDSNFIVRLLNLDGEVAEYLANEIGEVDMTQATGIDETGVYYLEVIADSDWEVTIE